MGKAGNGYRLGRIRTACGSATFEKERNRPKGSGRARPSPLKRRTPRLKGTSSTEKSISEWAGIAGISAVLAKATLNGLVRRNCPSRKERTCFSSANCTASHSENEGRG